MTNEGWVCSRCGKSLAPSVRECDCQPTETLNYVPCIPYYYPNTAPYYPYYPYFPYCRYWTVVDNARTAGGKD